MVFFIFAYERAPDLLDGGREEHGSQILTPVKNSLADHLHRIGKTDLLKGQIDKGVVPNGRNRLPVKFPRHFQTGIAVVDPQLQRISPVVIKGIESSFIILVIPFSPGLSLCGSFPGILRRGLCRGCLCGFGCPCLFRLFLPAGIKNQCAEKYNRSKSRYNPGYCHTDL